MRESVRRTLFSLSLILIWLVPPVAIGTGILVLTFVWSPSRLAGFLTLVLGARTEVRAVELPRPGIVRLRDVCVKAPWTSQDQLWLSRIELRQNHTTEYWEIDEAEVTPSGLSLLRRLVEKHLLLKSLSARRIVLRCNRLVVINAPALTAAADSSTHRPYPQVQAFAVVATFSADLGECGVSLNVHSDPANSPGPVNAKDHRFSPIPLSGAEHENNVAKWHCLAREGKVKEELSVASFLPVSLIQAFSPLRLPLQEKNRTAEFSGTLGFAGSIERDEVVRGQGSLVGIFRWQSDVPPLDVGKLCSGVLSDGLLEVRRLAFRDGVIEELDCILDARSGEALPQQVSLWERHFHFRTYSDKKLGGEEEVGFASAGREISPDPPGLAFDSLHMRICWERHGVWLLPVGGERGYWAVAFRGGRPVLVTTPATLATRLTWKELISDAATELDENAEAFIAPRATSGGGPPEPSFFPATLWQP